MYTEEVICKLTSSSSHKMAAYVQVGRGVRDDQADRGFSKGQSNDNYFHLYYI